MKRLVIGCWLAASLLWANTLLGQTADSSKETATKQDIKEKDEEITAKVTKVIDGDSIKVRSAEGKEYEVQLEGTDAPEAKQEYGKESSDALKKLLFDSDVRVTWKKKDNFERPLAQVYRGETHVNAEMIRSGNAWHFKRYNQSKALADLEIEAKNEKRGLWKAENPVAPWDYRKENRTPDKPDR
jgi:micrococcal nuclease